MHRDRQLHVLSGIQRDPPAKKTGRGDWERLWTDTGVPVLKTLRRETNGEDVSADSEKAGTENLDLERDRALLQAGPRA